MKREEATLLGISKECRCCSQTKTLELFVKNKAFKSGYDTICLQCNYKKAKQWRETHTRNYTEEYKRYKQKYPNKINSYAQLYRKQNKDKVKIISAKNHTKRRLRDVCWDKEFTQFVTEEAHAVRLLRDRNTNLVWHVDHIIPLNGRIVSGLHVWNNIQVIPATTNLRKSNSYG